ncbi:DUF2691 family protein [Bacillus sp. DX1.1]|uniref:DUF2691 family protein n=1 Tax=unclassified Bacillus (in: firmicutes) TaxID=185979 RepID=UPI0025700367|nr:MULTISPECIES: DUF2691 family protein [unclassified Bacillus (in: firmicutes)]MDM5155188.1 DUF2691 family protein [Bacillus sp. DX1.1]WJE79510.1 DUF2691 family protein [Bacillus sp. DX3.1]
MERGISFMIPNEYGMYLSQILQPVDLKDFLISIETVEIYDGKQEHLFPKENYVIEGTKVHKIINEQQYYIVFTDFKIYPKHGGITEIETYEEFLHSDCELILLIAECEYVTLYCKDKNMLNQLYENAIKQHFTDVEYVTDLNDDRTGMSV